jgi:hypothetical protein
VATLKEAGLCCDVASSASPEDASPEELTPLLAIAGAAELFDHAIKADEVNATKPDPDVVLGALAWSRADPANAVMIAIPCMTSTRLTARACAASRCAAGIVKRGFGASRRAV